MKEGNQKKLSREIDRFLSERGSEPAPVEQFGRLHLVASLREHFTVESLQREAGMLEEWKNRESDPEQSINHILDDSRFFYSEDGAQMYWEYRQDKKRKVLEAAVKDGVANSAAQKLGDEVELKPREEAVKRVISGDTQSWRQEDDLPRLRFDLEAATLLEGLTEVPPLDALRKRIAWLETLQPFRVLTENFSGRKDQLRELRAYVDFLPAEDAGEGVKRLIFRGLDRFRRLLSLKSHPLLVITGVGGVGKSALVSKFILDHLGHQASGQEQADLLFVYIDYDHGTVSLQDPADILREAVRQLALRLPEHAGDFTGLHFNIDRLRGQVSSGEKTQSLGNPRQSREESDHPSWQKSQSRQYGKFSSNKLEWTDLLDELAEIWERLPGKTKDAPFMLVLDSFEEVERLGLEEVLRLFDFLEKWSDRLPRFRPVLVGRSPVEGLPIKPQSIHLQEFDQESAVAYLMARGISDQSLALNLVSEYGGQPLSLKLVSEIVRQEEAGLENFKNPGKKGLIKSRIDTELTQSYLFKRHLGHIQDPFALKIAYPGLVVRRITPGIIRHVLAGPCELGELDDAVAWNIFNELAKEAFLVQRVSDDELQFRKDLRQVALQGVLDEAPARTRAIQDAAVAWYEGKTSLSDRAEYVYHRLLRGDAPGELEKELYAPGMEDFLSGSMEELPTEAYLYLAGIWSRQVPQKIRERADLEDWERNLALELEKIDGAGFMEETLRLYAGRLEERWQRSDLSLLPLQEVRLWMELGELERAEMSMKKAESIEVRRNEPLRVQGFFKLKGQLLERMGKYEEAAAAMWRCVGEGDAKIGVTVNLAVWLRNRFRAGTKEYNDWLKARDLLLKPLSGKVLVSLSSGYSGIYLRGLLFPLKYLSTSDGIFMEFMEQVKSKSSMASFVHYYAPDIQLESSYNMLFDDGRDLERFRHYLSAAEFAECLALARKLAPDFGSLNSLAMEIFQDRLGNLVKSNVYETALYDFVLQLEQFGRLDALRSLRK